MFSDFFSHINILDILDILVVAALLYYVFLLIQGTRAIQILKGVGFLLLSMVVSRYLALQTLYWILQLVMYGIVVALPIVFQPELRRALGFLGRGGGFKQLVNSLLRDNNATRTAIESIVWAVEELASNKTGALIVFERGTGLEEYIETGTILDAYVSGKLLISIFCTKTPLHDGAVIIRDFRVFAASCYLPLSENVTKTRGKGYGTRHRAALGLSEQTDAFIVVVSEETGRVSVARNGKMTRIQSFDSLKKFLTDNFEKNKTFIFGDVFNPQNSVGGIKNVFQKKSNS